jgi:hypothetical protein
MGAKILDVTVSIAGTSISTTTNAVGQFTLTGVPAGEVTVQTSHLLYQYQSQSVSVDNANTSTGVDFVLMYACSEGSICIQLTWDERPWDLDSHLWKPITEQYHIIPGIRFGSDTALPWVKLDRDDNGVNPGDKTTGGQGPENITIAQRVEGTYIFAVFNYSRLGTTSDNCPTETNYCSMITFPNTGGTVIIFDSSGIIDLGGTPAIFKVSDATGGVGDWWYVLDLNVSSDGSFTIVPVQQIYNSELPTFAPYDQDHG